MAHPLDEAHAKVRRARTHLNELNEKTRAFIEPGNYTIVMEEDEDTGRLLFVVRTDRPPRAIPVEFGIIAGDIAHNLRSALNYLVWQLASPPTGTGPGRDTQFPIFADMAGQSYPESARTRFRHHENRYLAGLTPAHRAVIERAQPYHGGTRRHLTYIARLSNRDKHQLVTTTLTVGTLEPHIIREDWPGQLSYVLDPMPVIYDGAILGELVSIEPHDTVGAVPDVKMHFDLALDIGFGEWPMIGITGNMDGGARYVDLILRVFRDAF